MNKAVKKISIIWTVLIGMLSWAIIIGGATITIHLLK